jgi:hypothetical protein
MVLMGIYGHRDIVRRASSQVRLEINTRDAPDIRPDNPAFFYIRYPFGYQIAQLDIR